MRPEACSGVLAAMLAAAAVATAGCANAPRPWLMGEASQRPGVFGTRIVSEGGMSADVVTFDEAVALASELKYAEAAAKFRMVLGRFEVAGDTRRAAETLFWLGFCHEKLGDVATARQYYNSVLARWPGTPAARRAGEHLARLAAAEMAPK